MKRLFIVLLLCTLILTGCNLPDQIDKPANFYYLHSEFSFGASTSLCSPEVVESLGMQFEELLNLYFQGPVSETLRSPFHPHVKVVHLEVTDTQIILILSEEYAALKDLDLILANTCLYETCRQLVGDIPVRLHIDGTFIDGQDHIIIDGKNMITYDHHATIPKE